MEILMLFCSRCCSSPVNHVDAIDLLFSTYLLSSVILRDSQMKEMMVEEKSQRDSRFKIQMMSQMLLNVAQSYTYSFVKPCFAPH